MWNTVKASKFDKNDVFGSKIILGGLEHKNLK